MTQWAIAPLEGLYNSIEQGSLDNSQYDRNLADLKALNVLDGKTKNATSRAQLEKGEIKLSSGDIHQVNEAFVFAAIGLSDELNLDEVVSAELILLNCDIDSDDENSNIALINGAKVAFYIRRQYVLQIVSYVTNCCDSNDKVYSDLVSDGTLIKNLVSAFKEVETQLEEIKQLVTKTKMLDSYDAFAKQNVRFRRDFLLTEYDSLSQILHGLVRNGTFMKKERLLDIVHRVSDMDPSDFFIVYFLSSLLQAFSQLHVLPDSDVRDLHKQFVEELKNDTIYAKPVKVAIIFAFLAFFIGWCKEDPSKRASSYDFATAVDEPMTKAVSLGAIEQFMAFAADTSELEKDSSIELFYDIRSLLQKHIPRLYARQLIDTDQSSHEYNSNSSDFETIRLSQQGQNLLLPAFNQLLQVIITDCAFLLTKMKDAEEDSLLSGEDLFLDEISAKADLERFFLTVHYFYAFRPEYCAVFWQDKESSAYGFIEWAMKCTDTLMRSSVFLMLSSLAFGEENSLNVYHYVNQNSQFSWIHIAQIISDYIVKILDVERKLEESQGNEKNEQDLTAVAMKSGLNEEVIVLLSSLYTLVGCVSHDLDEVTKSHLSKTFTSILFEFVKVNTPLLGAALKVLSNLVPQSEGSRSNFWYKLDSWIFRDSKLSLAQKSYREAYGSVLTTFSDVTGFLNLLESLLRVCTTGFDEYLKFGVLPFPAKLGKGYRNVGVWPYFNYVFNEVFVQSQQLTNMKEKAAVQKPILQIIDYALRSFDYSVILNSIPAGSNLDELVETDDFYCYVQESPATAAINYLFEEKVFTVLFANASFGVDNLAFASRNSSESLELLKLALKNINQLLVCQETYVEELCPIVKRNTKADYFLPHDFGIHGLKSFYNAVFFDLPMIAHFGLYVGLEDCTIASQSLQILKKLAVEMKGHHNKAIVKDTLLSVFDSVDESARVKEAFINQLLMPITDEETLRLKVEILSFLSQTLFYTDKQPSVAHFLLGFFIGSTLSLGPDLNTFISSGHSVLDSIIFLLQSSLEMMNDENIENAPVQLASLSMEIILKLCRNTLTSTLILSRLSDSGLFEKLLVLDPKVNNITRWSSEIISGNSANGFPDYTDEKSAGAFLRFLSYRTFSLQFLSLDIHRLSSQSLKANIDSRIDLLISDIMQPPRIFSFLDVLSFEITALPSEVLQELIVCADIDLGALKAEDSISNSDKIYDMTRLHSLVQLKTQSLSRCLPIVTPHTTIPDTEALYQVSKSEEVILTNYLSTNFSFHRFKSLQLSVLHSWVQLVQIVVLDGHLSKEARSKFILELFEALVPRIMDCIELDVAYTEEIVSLCVFLYDTYHKDHHLHSKSNSIDGRLMSLFMACINGIRSPLSTLSLRSDFYALANRFLSNVLKDSREAKQIAQTLKMSSGRLIEVVFNDAISGEGSSRITGILFLDSLFQLASLHKVNFALESLVKTNMLLLIGHSLTATDDFLKSGLEGISLDNLLYELTAFKSTIHFLIRVAETRSGAQALVQNDIFHVIESCSFLKVDPDLGLDLVFDEVSMDTSNPLHVSLSLDSSLTLNQDACGLSLFEIVVPVFQLMTSILLSMGSANKAVVRRTRTLLDHFRKLVQGVLKRDALIEEDESFQRETMNSEGLAQLVKLVVLLCTLTAYK
ncbi:LAME_0D07756g1_1 [Lachancea meyersii CBS 8951]|uniref:LAME_0D07756g1_1 n=1 Tax=Lachancea meyersii CBS 8951 TaxID=1266667 RepID=A0A1G4JAI3_9SACH|nr:LAME_0D07756g1_1 [Lachancea meyersii CBS 8951]